MPPSQLKRLKASLREQGITGPQRSKKQKKNDKTSNSDHRVQRNAALANIREDLNPFDIKVLARPKKFDVTTNKPASGKLAKSMVGRPGVTKSFGEEARRRTLLPEMQRRNKVGGVHDRRFGESDPTLTSEEKMLERFARETSRKKRHSLFDLEEGDDEDFLTHLGQSLDLPDKTRDDFDAGSISASSEDERMGRSANKRSRQALEDGNGFGAADEEADQPERKKSKAEVMKEVIAKSKMYKYERQQAKEDDEELREELDNDLTDLRAALTGKTLPPRPAPAPVENNPHLNPERAALIQEEAASKDKEFDEHVRQMALDQRAKPTDRTKTEEEQAMEMADKLKALEEKRLKRMRGEEVENSEDESRDMKSGPQGDEDIIEDDEADDAAEFGFTGALKSQRPQGVDDEDDFLIEENLVANGSDVDSELSEDSDSEASDVTDVPEEEDEDDEFIQGLLSNDDHTKGQSDSNSAREGQSQLAFTYPCPRSHIELLKVLGTVPVTEIPTVVQRIRALYHPQLQPENKEKLADFSSSLVDHLSHMANQNLAPPLSVIDMLIRHVHSLSRSFAERIATQFRHHLQNMSQSGELTPGDIVLLTAISTIYPTSDHFHQVVTPAVTVMARWLGITTPRSAKDISRGAYVIALCIQYQKLSKRYIPETVRFTVAALKSPEVTPKLLQSLVENISAMADLWSGKPAFIEIFSPTILPLLTELKQNKALQRLKIQLSQARLARRPLELHHHRPLPIKMSIPKFEEGFNPDKHYDPDRDRADASKLRAEYKRERKGALRELRKDANFIAREKLREKKERDRVYEAKYKRLVAEIQGEEGREKNAYEREKRARKGKK